MVEAGGAGTVPWVATNSQEDWQRLQNTRQSTMLVLQNFQPGGPEKNTGADDSRHALQENRGLADFRHRDDGDILCHPVLVLHYLAVFDTAIAEIVAERNRQKTEVVSDLGNWKIGNLRHGSAR